MRVEQVGLPPGVDGILGIDVLRGFAAAELDCAAALGAATSDAVAARPAALVAVATLVLYWAALPVR